MQCTCGWKLNCWPQVCSTALIDGTAPSHLGSLPRVSKQCEALSNNDGYGNRDIDNARDDNRDYRIDNGDNPYQISGNRAALPIRCPCWGSHCFQSCPVATLVKRYAGYCGCAMVHRVFAIAVGLFSFLGFVIIMTKNYYHTEKQYLYMVTGFAGMLFLNVFIPHLMSTIYLRRYSPEIVTGLLINLPLVSLILWSIYSSQKLTTGQISLSVIIGGLIGIILAFLFLKIGSFIDNSKKRNLKVKK